ncbi:aldo/keto reductase family protein [Dictyobacter arantiisoli]|uniref:Aldo/keto reductase n=1 Tax=Dictyobacter arantiisoli TaxID=2014874 RepID=A0A5A5T8Y9_9CHLR|nr:aldo/keto reductase family protein [Dictyobacter arantiisoli]GCF07503.1 aldo/keto reductase [Dictyobacter arantiisoli]
MEYRHLGRSGVRVSSIALGSWLTYGTAVEKQTAIDCIHHAYESGVNFFDTANNYNNGEAEKAVGQALKEYPRSSYFLATKVYFPVGKGPNDRGLSRKHIMEQCHASLKRLGVEYIDLYQCHRHDPASPMDEILRAMDDLVRQGKVNYVGVSEWTATNISDAVHTAEKRNFDKIVSHQPSYSLLDRHIEPDVVPLCEREGIGQIVFSPLAQGVLTGKYKPGQQPASDTRAANKQTNTFMQHLLKDETLAAVQRLQKLADEGGYKLSQLALAWVLGRPNVSSAIIGASRPEQIDENLKSLDITLSESDLKRIDETLEGVITY